VPAPASQPAPSQDDRSGEKSQQPELSAEEIDQSGETQEAPEDDIDEAHNEEVAEDEEVDEDLPADQYWANELCNLPILELKFPPLHPLDAYLKHNVSIVEQPVQMQAYDHSEANLLAAWATLLCRYSQSEEVAVGVESSSSDTGTLIVRVPVSQEWDLAQLKDVVNRKLSGARRNASQLDLSLQGAYLSLR
jgi:hypothetical protein